MEDLNAASLDDVKEWFQRYYGAANATLVVGGDIDTKDVKARVEKYFGDIPPDRRSRARRPGSRRWSAPSVRRWRTASASRASPMVWNIAPWGDPSLEHLGLFGEHPRGRQDLAPVPAPGREGAARHGLPRRRRVAASSAASSRSPSAPSPTPTSPRSRRSSTRSSPSSARQGPNADELERVRAQQLAQFVRGVERVGGGFGGQDRHARRGLGLRRRPGLLQEAHRAASSRPPSPT